MGPHLPIMPMEILEQQGGWSQFADASETLEGSLQLTGWSRKRPVAVMRRRETLAPQASAHDC